MEADNLQQLIVRFVILLAQFPILTWSDDNFDPRFSAGDKAISYVVPKTKKKHLEHFVAALNQSFYGNQTGRKRVSGGMISKGVL